MVAGRIINNAIGPQDFYLTGNPQMSFFKSVFLKHTRFSIITKQIYFRDTPTFGSTGINAILNREGDLLKNLFLEVTITGTSTNNNSYTINHFGNSLIKNASLKIGGQVIDSQNAQWLQIFNEFTNPGLPYTPYSCSNGGKKASMNFNNSINLKVFNLIDRSKGNCPLVFCGGFIN